MKIRSFFLACCITASLCAEAPKAVVFDFGGVMTGKQNREAVVDFLQNSFGFTDEEFERVNQEKRLALKEGKTDGEFWLGYAEKNGIELPSDWVDSLYTVMRESIGVNPHMYQLVDELKDHQISVGLLSNIDERLSKLMRDFDLYSPFSPCLLSCEIGVNKPDAQAYEHLLRELDLPAHTVVFVDDKLENVEAAKGMGIDAILFESESQLRAELNQRGAFE